MSKVVAHKHYHIIYIFEIVISYLVKVYIFLSENLYYPCFSSSGSKVAIFIAFSFVSSKVFV